MGIAAAIKGPKQFTFGWFGKDRGSNEGTVGESLQRPGVPLTKAHNSDAFMKYSNVIFGILGGRLYGFFTAWQRSTVSIGDDTGSLDAMLSKVADFYENEVGDLVDTLSSRVEPMIMVVLSALIGDLVIAMCLPIFKLGPVV